MRTWESLGSHPQSGERTWESLGSHPQSGERTWESLGSHPQSLSRDEGTSMLAACDEHDGSGDHDGLVASHASGSVGRSHHQMEL
jgi:hypothetical protein